MVEAAAAAEPTAMDAENKEDVGFTVKSKAGGGDKAGGGGGGGGRIAAQSLDAFKEDS